MKPFKLLGKKGIFIVFVAALFIPWAKAWPQVPLTFGDYPVGYATINYVNYYALWKGIVKPEGVKLNMVHAPLDVAPRLMMAGERDLGILAFNYYLVARARNLPLAAIAVESRALSTENLKYNLEANAIFGQKEIKSPKELEGKKVGVPGLLSGSTIYFRALLKYRFGVDIAKIIWIDKPLPILFQLLKSGEVDAANIFGVPTFMAGKEPSLKLLFVPPDEWPKMTGGLYMIFTLIVAKKDQVEKNPQALKNVLLALRQSAQYGQKNVEEILEVASKELGKSKEDLKRGYTERYVQPFGVTPQDKEVLKLVTKHAVEQKVIERELEPETLFADIGQ